MSDAATENVNVLGFSPLRSPAELSRALPASDEVRRRVSDYREEISRILAGDDSRLLVIAGPCSIHDVAAAEEFATKLKTLADDVRDRAMVVMRVYFEKPRTTVGWKGLINDPFLYSDREFDMDTGLRIARQLLLRVAEIGLPAATEFLDPFTPQYLDDLVSWAAIGARTTESQTHRQMASGLSMPVGFKNATTGDIQVALDAMAAAKGAHHFLGIDDDGRASIVHTRGNPTSHVILRGGHKRSNFDADDVADAAERLERAGLPPRLMVDCSHANSFKKHEQQEVAFRSVVEQRTGKMSPVIGVMIEANLHAGRQNLPDDAEGRRHLKHGVSVTDACIGFDELANLVTTTGKTRS
jgi:3-deoxy-7-phosphoheptulonate synthase